MKITPQIIFRAKDVKVRNKFSKSLFETFTSRISNIVNSIDFISEKTSTNSKVRKELTRHIPTALVASIQGYVKQLIAVTLDSNRTLIKQVKKIETYHFDIESIIAMESEKVTVGEIIAQLVNLNSLDSILSFFDSLSEQNIKSTMKPLDISFYSQKRPLFEDNIQEIMRTISDIFSNRHVLCHEMSTEFRASRKKLIHWSQMTYLFICGLDYAVGKVFFSDEDDSVNN